MAMVNDEQVIKALRQYNLWWRNPAAIKEESKPQKRIAYYEALKMIQHKTLRRFAVLSGARRVGKTTIMYQMIENLIDEGVSPKNILYVSFDNPIVKLVDVESVLSIYESLYPIEGMRYIFLDEIQYTDNWELWMKVIYDNRKDIRLTATGSASDVSSKGALRGRPKIFIADAAISNAVLMIDDVLSDEKELGAMVETTVYKHIVSFYQGSTAQLGYFRKAKDNQKEVDVVVELPSEKILCEVKYRGSSGIPASDAIVELCKDENIKTNRRCCQ